MIALLVGVAALAYMAPMIPGFLALAWASRRNFVAGPVAGVAITAVFAVLLVTWPLGLAAQLIADHLSLRLSSWRARRFLRAMET